MKMRFQIEDFLLSYWKGEKKLWKAFWVMGFVFQILIFYFLLFLLYVGQFIGLTWSIKITVFLFLTEANNSGKSLLILGKIKLIILLFFSFIIKHVISIV